jgi:hypothetical protein
MTALSNIEGPRIAEANELAHESPRRGCRSGRQSAQPGSRCSRMIRRSRVVRGLQLARAMESKWLRWAGLAVALSPWGCGGSAHEQSDPSNRGGAPNQGGGAGVIGAGYPGGSVLVEAGSPGASQGGSPISGGGSAGASSAGAPPTGNCDYLNEVTISTQADADRLSACSNINGVFVADVAEPLVIDWPALTTVNGELHFARDAKLTRISLPNLRQLDGELYLKANAALKTVELPALIKITGDANLDSAIFVQDNPQLTRFVVSLDLRTKGATRISGSPLLCDAANLIELRNSNALSNAYIDLPCTYPSPDPGSAGAAGSTDF